nr:hypothetical protein [uncultured Sphingomonas sp.]
MPNEQLGLPLDVGPGPRNHRRAIRTCIYCGRNAETRDHVPPKALLLEPWPNNLRTVPSCSPCNTDWSLDEQYLAIMVAHLTQHPEVAARLNPGSDIYRALEAAPRLDDRIVNLLSVDEEGRVRLAPEIGRMARIGEKIAHGLHVLKYGTGPKLADFRVLRIFGPGEELPQSLVAAQWNWPGITRKRWTNVQKGIFSFLFARGWMADDPPLYCLIDLADTLLLVVSCPAPVGKAASRRLRSKAWP